MQGWRDSMEVRFLFNCPIHDAKDAHLVAMHLHDAPQISAFGVFDGHGGSLIATRVYVDGIDH